MYRGYRSRKKEAQARTAQHLNMPAGPVTPSSTSLASSLSSSAPSSLLPAALLSDSSRSDILPSDHSVSSYAPTTPPKPRFFPIALSPTARSSSAAPMGQSSSRPDPSSPHSPVQTIPSAAASATSLTSPPSRLKRILGRRKKSEDVTSAFANAQYPSNKGKERERDPSISSSTFSTPASSVDDFHAQQADDLERPSRSRQPLALHLPSPLSPQRKRSQSRSPKAPKFSASPPPVPPIPPPKPSPPDTSDKILTPTAETHDDVSSPLVPLGTGSAVAVQFMQSQGQTLSPGLRERSDSELKQDWRKSDSTVLSYVTIRPGALAGSRSPRPVSLAESSHSGHTIVPVNKRLSALITDAEFAMAEENDSDSEQDLVRITVSGRPSPASSVKARNRRSASMNLGSGYLSHKAMSEALGSRSATPRLSRTFTDTSLMPLTSHDTPTLSRAAASGIMVPPMPDVAQPASSGARGRLAMWTSPSPAIRPLGAPSTPQPRRTMAPPGHNNRQTSMSISGGLAPVALGLGRRAAEKMQRVWEGLSSASSNQDASARTPSRQSIYTHQPPIPGGWKSRRRTPEASSGSWSVASSIASSSESDAFPAPSGPKLGVCLRGPKRNVLGMSVTSGLVFGKDLRTCVRDTAITQTIPESREEAQWYGMKPVEQRLLPAIVVRCYQHLMIWGLQEEGLFRVPGRNTHLTKLRSEFDTGADFELAQCEPSELDPHAVASVFKAYLRELPESLLTAALIPRFEAALPKESETSQMPSLARAGLPQLRKPPSLSTFAIPSFAGQRSISQATMSELAGLIAQLPVENRDLLYTVVELISATDARKDKTKMPLGNLMLLFCPTLGVSHALLRVLCEAKEIWLPPKLKQGDSVIPSKSGEFVAQSEVVVSPASPQSSHSSSSSLSSDTDSESDLSDLPPARPRIGGGRGPVRTMLYAPDGSASPYASSSTSGSGLDDGASYVSALDHSPAVSNDSSNNLPALTTSTDSIATPSTMSEVSSLQQSTTEHVSGDDMKDLGSQCPEEPDVDLSLPTPAMRPIISAPIPFPSSGSSSPQTPSSRKSVALLSFPPLNKSDSGSPGGPLAGHRPKRPSLTLLFSKRSISSLGSPVPRTPKTPEGSTSTRSSSLQIPVPSRPSVSPEPPVLDTLISSSPIRLFDTIGQLKLQDMIPPSPGSLLVANDTDWQGRERVDSSSSSLFSTPQQTPIADFFRGRSTSFISVPEDAHVDPQGTSSSQPTVPPPRPLTPTIEVGLDSLADGEWAESVIQEARASSESFKPSWQGSSAVTLS